MNKATKVTVAVMVCTILLLCQSARGQRLRCRPGSMVCEVKRSFITKQVKRNKFMLRATPSR